MGYNKWLFLFILMAAMPMAGIAQVYFPEDMVKVSARVLDDLSGLQGKGGGLWLALLYIGIKGTDGYVVRQTRLTFQQNVWESSGKYYLFYCIVIP